MIKAFEQFGFSVERTQDQSPTLRLLHQGESMHHFGGAASETRYIYAEIIEKAHELTKTTQQLEINKMAVVGLGLGYIEISWAASLIKNNLQPSEKISFDSFEVIQELKDQFKNWIFSEGSHDIYDEIAQKIAPQISIFEIKKILQQALKNGSHLHGDIISELNKQMSWNLICYDAFSKKTNEDLWSEDFLNSLFKNHTANDCIITSYACTSSIKKVLRENQFNVIYRKGFQGKRESTLATRGAFKFE